MNIREKKKNRIFTIFIASLFLFNIISCNITAHAQTVEDEDKKDTPYEKIDWINISKRPLKLIGYLFAKFSFILQMFAGTAIADPPVVEIGYNETVTTDIGIMNLTSGEFDTGDIPPFLTERYLKFRVVDYPGNNSLSWRVSFDPNTVIAGSGNPVKTKAKISLIAPPTGNNAIQSGIMRINVQDIWILGNLWWPKGNKPPFDTAIKKFLFWFLFAPIYGYGFNSGSVDIMNFDVDILVKVKPYHAAKFDALPLIKLKPDEIASIPITIQNLGNYNDTYNFRINDKTSYINLVEPPSITLSPGEAKKTYLAVSAPPKFFDTGTFHQIKIEAYSIYEPNVTVGYRTVNVETRGVFFSEIYTGGIVIILVIFLFIIYIFYLYKKHRLEKICVKPNKPWDIPEERQHLEKLKQKDKERYQKELEMMRQEYQSAILWYKYYIQDMMSKKLLRQKRQKKEEIKQKKIKEKTEMKNEKVKNIREIRESVAKQEKEDVAKEKRNEMDRRKQKILFKIRRSQEKQKNKLNRIKR